jgi:CheY-like chemotaxis protein
MAMNHFRAEEWIDLVNRTTTQEQMAAMQDHLASGVEPTYQPPDQAVRNAGALFSTAAWVGGLKERINVGETSFDSLLQPAYSSALQNGNMSIKVLLADDSQIVRRLIRHLLSAQTRIEIVGEAANFAQTIQMASDLEPQVIVMDLHMPDEDNVTPQQVKSRLNRGSQVLAISVCNDEESRELAENVGAAIFLDKMDLSLTLIPTIMQLKRERSAAP